MKFIRKNIKLISILIFITILTILIYLKFYLKNNKKVYEEKEIIKEEIVIKENELEKEENVNLKIETVFVDIKGAIKTPGVYEIESDKKVIDVVNKAGGLTNKADTSMVNLAKNVTNEMVIIIYTKEEIEKYKKQEEIIKVIDKECICPSITNDACINNDKKDNNSTNKNTTNEQEKIDANKEKININTATIEELQTLNGIGEGKAEAIIKYRDEHGIFKDINELKEVTGIGESVYEKIKDNITI